LKTKALCQGSATVITSTCASQVRQNSPLYFSDCRGKKRLSHVYGTGEKVYNALC